MKEQLINVVDIICHAFEHVDHRLISHGERVAYILMKMLEGHREFTSQEKQDIFMLGLLHDIGAYKDEEIDAMLSFDQQDSMEHSIFGYLLFQTFSPLPEYADVILYHHHCNAQYYSVPISEYNRQLARLLYLADRIDIFCVLNDAAQLDSFLQDYDSSVFADSDILWFKEADRRHHILEQLHSGGYRTQLKQYTRLELLLTEAQMYDYLMMFIFSVDFRSEYTMLHTSYALHFGQTIARTLRLTSTSCKIIELSALLHNIGKISFPFQVETMDDYGEYLKEVYHRSTLSITKEILENAADPQIIQIIDQSFLLLDCWFGNTPVTCAPSPAAEIVSLSYLLSNALTLDADINADHYEQLIQFLTDRYRTCRMDNTILQSLKQYYPKIISETRSACSSVADTYRHILEEEHSLNMILLHYNKKYF